MSVTKTLLIVAVCLLLSLSLSSSVTRAAEPAGSTKTLKFAVIPKGTTHSFWKSVEAGARAAGKEFNVEILWKGPLKEDDRADQIKVVEQFTSQGVDGIVLAPLDDTALRRPVKAAVAAKIPVVIFDSALKGSPGKDFVSFVATDNKIGGRIGGEELARLIGGKGKVVLLRYQEGSASTMEREAGFLEAIEKFPGITVTVKNKYAGATAGESKTVALQLADELKQADGVFAVNESSTFGMLLALKQLGLAGKIKFVGFDAAADLIKGLQADEIQALVAQNPNRMGYESVKALAAHVRGQTVEQRIDSGCRLVTKESLSDADMRKFLGMD